MRTIRLLITTSPVAATEHSAEQCETLYAVASDETFWTGVWKGGVLTWLPLPTIPQPEVPANVAP